MTTAYLWLWIVVFSPALHQQIDRISSNRERVYLHLDKNDCIAGDTIFWKAYVCDDLLPMSPSTNLYIDFYDDSSRLITSQECLIFRDSSWKGGISAGQIRIPQNLKSQVCFLRASTRYQYTQDSTSSVPQEITVYNAVGYHQLPHFTFVSPLLDSVTLNEPGLLLTSHQVNDTLVCDVRANNLFKRWGDSLKLRIRGGVQKPEYFPFVLRETNPHLHLKIKLIEAFGYLHITLTGDTSVLAYERIFMSPLLPDSVMLTTDSLNTSPHGKNIWTISIKDSMLCDVSVSITDADKVEPASFNLLTSQLLLDTLQHITALREIKIDSNYLDLKGFARTGKGKLLPVNALAANLHQDSSHQMIADIPLDKNGNFEIKNCVFLDSFYLAFQRNNLRWNMADVKLTIFNRNPPPFVIPAWLQKEDTLVVKHRENPEVIFSEDSTYHALKGGLFATKQLKTIVIKINKYRAWDQYRQRLNDKYCPGTPISPWFYDLTGEDADAYATSLVDYLSKHQPGFTYNMGDMIPIPKLLGKNCLIFIDDTQLFAWQLVNTQLRDVAFIKVDKDYTGALGEDDTKIKWDKQLADFQAGVKPSMHSDTPESNLTGPHPHIGYSEGPSEQYAAIMIYTRHREDWKLLPANMHEIALPGFSQILPLNASGDGRWTLFWSPYENNHFKVSFTNNNYTKRFRVHIEGIDQTGHIIEYEKVIGG